MLGNIGEMMSLLSDKDKLINKLKKETPAVLEMLTAQIALHAGAQPGDEVGVMLFKVEETTMASVFRLDELFRPVELISTIDLVQALNAMPNDDIKKMMKF